jgi:trimethylamine:corrinoid methyltransferase-like protein
MRILNEIGIEFLNDDAVAHLKAAGCSVEGQMSASIPPSSRRWSPARPPSSR